MNESIESKNQRHKMLLIKNLCCSHLQFFVICTALPPQKIHSSSVIRAPQNTSLFLRGGRTQHVYDSAMCGFTSLIRGGHRLRNKVRQLTQIVLLIYKSVKTARDKPNPWDKIPMSFLTNIRL